MGQVAGGGLFYQYKDEEYRAAGVEIGDPDFFWNTGYKFHGEAIESSQADALVLFYQKNGRLANSLEEANNFMERMVDEVLIEG